MPVTIPAFPDGSSSKPSDQMARPRIGLPAAVLAALPKRRATKGGKRRTRWLRGWKLYLLGALALPFLFLSGVTIYYYVTFSRMIDARMHG